jgi:hypothetical protein
MSAVDIEVMSTLLIISRGNDVKSEWYICQHAENPLCKPPSLMSVHYILSLYWILDNLCIKSSAAQLVCLCSLIGQECNGDTRSATMPCLAYMLLLIVVVAITMPCLAYMLLLIT